MLTRRNFLTASAMASAGAILPLKPEKMYKQEKSLFRYCLNTSTVSKQPLEIMNYIGIASGAGYDGIEIWIRDLAAYLKSGKSAGELKRYIEDKGLIVENAIGFAPWLAPGNEGFRQMKEEMEMLASIGCRRIAAPPAGLSSDKPLDLFKAGEHYRELLDLGRQTGVMPQLEFWGSSKALWHIGQVLMIIVIAADSDSRILPDVYHMFRGGSSFDTLKMIDGSLIEVFHINDYISTIPREEQKDSDRVYPGDGEAPLKEIIEDLKFMGGTKILSLELFNESYWKEDPVITAQKGLKKMKAIASS